MARGKVYLAKSAMGGDASGGGMVVSVPGAAGRMLSLRVSDDDMAPWEVSEQAYAVVLKDRLEDWKRGEVVVVTDWTEDGKLEVEGLGYVAADGLELLDRTNVTPGIRVLDMTPPRVWRRVVAVDDALWIRVNGEFKSPEEFSFPVSWDCELLSEPLVTCIRPWDPRCPHGVLGGISDGNRYYPEGEALDGKWLVKGDDGVVRAYPKGFFRMG
jgi:hypothetical protein